MNNDDLIPRTPVFQNPMADLLARMDAQDRLNKESARLSTEMVGLLREVMSQLKSQSESLASISQWIESQQK